MSSSFATPSHADFVPLNRLEWCLMEGRNGPAAMETFFAELARSEIYLPQDVVPPDDRHAEGPVELRGVYLPTVERGGRKYVMAYTSEEQLSQARGPLSYLRLYLADLARMMNGPDRMGIVLNLGAQHTFGVEDSFWRRFGDHTPRDTIAEQMSPPRLVPRGEQNSGIPDETRARMIVTELMANRQAGNHDHAVKLGDQLWEQFSHAQDVAVARQVATGTVYKGISLFRANRAAQAATAFDAVANRYGSLSDPELQRIVKDAREMRQNCG